MTGANSGGSIHTVITATHTQRELGPVLMRGQDTGGPQTVGGTLVLTDATDPVHDMNHPRVDLVYRGFQPGAVLANLPLRPHPVGRGCLSKL